MGHGKRSKEEATGAERACKMEGHTRMVNAFGMKKHERWLN